MILIKNIKELIQVEEGRLKVPGKEMAHLPVLKDAWLFIDGDRIIDFGTSEDNYELRIANYEKTTRQLTSSPTRQFAN